MDTEKKTGERIGITLALLACVGFSAFLIWLQQSQENDRQQLTQQVQDSGQREEQTEGSGQIEESCYPEQNRGSAGIFPAGRVLSGGYYGRDRCTGGKQYLLYTGWHGAGSGERNSL